MAAQLRKEPDVAVELVPAGLGELTVSVDDRPVYQARRWWFPMPGKIIERVRSALA